MNGASLVVTLLAFAAVAGCASSPDGPAVPPQPWTWPAMDVKTTASEPFESVGYIRAAWGDDAFALESQKESDLAPRTIVSSDAIYSSYGTRWTSDALGSGLVLGNRPVLWDLRHHVAAGELDSRVIAQRPDGSVEMEFTGTATRAGEVMPLTMRVVVRDGTVASATLSSPAGRESPYTFEPAGTPPSFEPRVPADARARAEVQPLDTAAQDAHAFLVQLLKDYQARHAGALPEQVTPDALRAELLLRGATWPENPYDGTPQAHGDGPGAFSWTRCALDRGLFVGHRWDGETTRQPFGASCPGS